MSCLSLSVFQSYLYAESYGSYNYISCRIKLNPIFPEKQHTFVSFPALPQYAASSKAPTIWDRTIIYQIGMHGNSPYKASPFSGWSNSVKGGKMDWRLTLPPRVFWWRHKNMRTSVSHHSTKWGGWVQMTVEFRVNGSTSSTWYFMNFSACSLSSSLDSLKNL